MQDRTLDSAQRPPRFTGILLARPPWPTFRL